MGVVFDFGEMLEPEDADWCPTSPMHGLDSAATSSWLRILQELKLSRSSAVKLNLALKASSNTDEGVKEKPSKSN